MNVETVVEKILLAETRAEIRDARVLAADWVRRHPADRLTVQSVTGSLARTAESIKRTENAAAGP